MTDIKWYFLGPDKQPIGPYDKAGLAGRSPVASSHADQVQWRCSETRQDLTLPTSGDHTNIHCSTGVWAVSQLNAETLCWAEGLAEWLPVQQIAELEDVPTLAQAQGKPKTQLTL